MFNTEAGFFKNIFDPQLVEFVDAESTNIESQLYINTSMQKKKRKRRFRHIICGFYTFTRTLS
jgi:hypothetical protein